MTGREDQAKSIFLGALEIAAEEDRRAYVEARCGGDDALRREVEELLRHQEQMGAFLEPAARGAAATVEVPPVGERPGTVIGPYKLLQKIGEGGFGVVYMADQTEPVKRRVALKIIKPGMDTRQVIARFEAERQALAMMDHPNIAKVLDAGMTGESGKGNRSNLCEAPEGPFRQIGPVPFSAGRPYFVMELVKGVPITRFCDEHHLTPRERLELFVPVCQAIQHAHQKGVIHRDIKPTNVLVAEYDDRAVPKIIDFGVAKATEQRLTEKTMFTQFGQVIGTVDYMSPEQAKLNEMDIDTRSDIYSLGVLLYELLAGETPFDRQRLRSAAFDELLRIIREEEPPKPSTRLSTSESLSSIAANRHTEPKKLSTLVRGELDWIVMKALEKDRTRRYETANGFADDIQRYLSDEAVVACPPSAAYRFRKFARRNKALLTTLGLVAATLVLGVVASTSQAIRATWAEREANRERDIARAERIEAEEARQHAEDASSAERQQRQEVTRLLASSYVDRAQALCEQGEIGQGMLWFAHSLRTAPDDAHDLDHLIRANLAAWARQLHSLTTLVQAPSQIVAVDLSPDGSRILTGGADGALRLWDAAEGRLIAEAAVRHEAWASLPSWAHVRCAVFSPDGSRILTASYEQAAHLWNAATLEPVGKPLQHVSVDGPLEPEDRVRIVAFSPDGSRIATASGHRGVGTVRLWDAVTLEPVGEPFHAGNPVTARFCPHGLRVLACRPADLLRLWDVDRGEPIGPSVQRPMPRDAAISPDGSMFATADQQGGIRLWRAGTNEPVLERIAVSARTLAFSPDGSRLLSGSNTRASTLWDTATGERVGPRLRQRSAARGLAFSQDGRRILTGGKDGSVRLWDVAPGRSAGPVIEHGDRVVAAGFGPQGLRLLTETDNSLQLRDAKTGEAIGTAFSQPGLLRRQRLVRRLVLSPDDSQLLIAGSHFQVRDVATGHLVSQSPEAYRDVAFSPDASRILVGGEAFARLWDTATLEPIGSTVPHGSQVGAVAFSPDGTRLLTGSDDGALRFWDAATLEPIGEPLAFQSAVLALAYSPDSKQFLTGLASGTARLWDSATLAPIGVPLQHQDIVQSVAFSSDGSRFLTHSRGETAQLWDTATQKPIGPWIEHETQERPRPFSRDRGEVLITGNRRARLWQTPPGPLQGERERIVLWTEVITGLRLNEREAVEALDGPARQERLRRLQELGGPPTTAPLLPAPPLPETGFSRAMDLALAGRDAAEQGQWDQAATDFSRAIELSGESPTLRAQIACWWGKLADDRLDSAHHDDCERLCRHAIALLKELAEDFPDKPEYRQQLARHYGRLVRVLRATGRPEDELEAKGHCRDALACILGEESEDKKPRRLRDEAAKLLGITASEATDILVKQYTEAIQRDAQDRQALRGRGDLLADLGQWERAIEDFSALIGIKPDDVHAHHLRGMCLNILGEFEAGLADSNRVIELDPDYTWGFSERAYSLNELGQPEQAIADCDRALHLNPRNYVAYVRRAEARAKLGQYEAAFVDVTAGIQLRPDQHWVWDILQRINLAADDPDLLAEALADLRAHFRELEPGSLTAIRLAELSRVSEETEADAPPAAKPKQKLEDQESRDEAFNNTSVP